MIKTKKVLLKRFLKRRKKMAKDFDIYVNEALGVVVAKFPSASGELREDF